MDAETAELIKGMREGSVRCLSRLISLVESGGNEAKEIIEAIAPLQKASCCVGITGAPGVGKSTLTDQIVAIARGKGLTVGVIAVDPSSPRHGGAVLGDRIRMIRHTPDDEVFIRSMATRGSYGGLPGCTQDIVKLLKAFGKDIVIIETVGVGQTDCAVADVADIVVLVLSPDSGDSIQLMKAGIMEIGDVIVINKAEDSRAQTIMLSLQALLAMDSSAFRKDTTICTTQALNDIGVRELFEELEQRWRVGGTTE
jgi:LAO/AO transport system kinase